MGKKAHVVAPVWGLLHFFRERQNNCANKATQIIDQTVADDLLQHNTATFIDFLDAALPKRMNQRILGAEMIMNRRLIALPRCQRDLARRHSLNAVFREQVFGCRQQMLFGVVYDLLHLMNVINELH